MSSPVFWEKRENVINFVSVEFAQRVVKVNIYEMPNSFFLMKSISGPLNEI